MSFAPVGKGKTDLERRGPSLGACPWLSLSWKHCAAGVRAARLRAMMVSGMRWQRRVSRREGPYKGGGAAASMVLRGCMSPRQANAQDATGQGGRLIKIVVIVCLSESRAGLSRSMGRGDATTDDCSRGSGVWTGRLVNGKRKRETANGNWGTQRLPGPTCSAVPDTCSVHLSGDFRV